MSSVYKQIYKSLLYEKAAVSVLFFLSCLGSFMYFFCSSIYRWKSNTSDL